MIIHRKFELSLTIGGVICGIIAPILVIFLTQKGRILTKYDFIILIFLEFLILAETYLSLSCLSILLIHSKHHEELEKRGIEISKKLLIRFLENMESQEILNYTNMEEIFSLKNKNTMNSDPITDEAKKCLMKYLEG
jgi:hypothetical protein